MQETIESPVEMITNSAHELVGSKRDYDPLLDMVGDARIVLLGEATHGTHEFYRERAQITKRLIKEKNFTAVVVEADWPDAYRVNRFVRGRGDDADAEEALGGFKRFPTWMWRNADVLDFVGWLHEYNDHMPEEAKKIGFYGLDLYSLNTSIESVLNYLKKIDPEEARHARARYSCFENFGEDPQSYSHSARIGQTCEEEVIRQLIELRRRSIQYSQTDGEFAAEDYFFAEQNARVVKNAEEYYRLMFHGRVSSWNLRDRHMAETLDVVMKHLGETRKTPRIVIWAHNSHLGDARAMQMNEMGELNLGQLVREKYGEEAISIGFTTFTGTVTAASEWDCPPERKKVREALPESYEYLFHEARLGRFFLNLREERTVKEALREPRLERAIGVIYSPQTERISHYFEAHLAEQFDAVLHFDQTRSVEPLERTGTWTTGEVPATFPFSV